MLTMARARVALGLAALTTPRLTGRIAGMSGSDPGRDYMTRLFGAREVALGAGYVFSDPTGRRLWARVGLAVDSADTLSGLRTRPGLPLWATAGAVGVAAGAATLGAAKIAKDLLSR